MWTIGGILFVTGWVVSLASWWLVSALLQNANVTLWNGLSGSASGHYWTFLAMVIFQTAIATALIRPVLLVLAGISVSIAAIFVVLCAGNVIGLAVSTTLYRLAEPTTAAGVIAVPSYAAFLSPVVTFATCAVEAALLRSLATSPGAGRQRSSPLRGYWIVLALIGAAALIASRSFDDSTAAPPASAPATSNVDVEGQLRSQIQSRVKTASPRVVTSVSCGVSPTGAAGWPDDQGHDHYTCTSTDSIGVLEGWCVQFSRPRGRIVAFYVSRSGCADPPIRMYAV